MIILLIGSTGYLGKSILETLLRNNIGSTIYLLIRPSNQSSMSRFESLLKNKCFSDVSISNIKLLEGSLNESLNFNIKFDVVINCAASIDFTEKLIDSVKNNVLTVQSLSQIAKDSKLIHVSTAYVNHPSYGGEYLPESLVPLQLNSFEVKNPNELLNKILNGEINFDQIQKITGYPNTYTFTKSLAEHILSELHNNLVIIRPSIITCAYKYPYPGWTDSYAAANGYIASFIGGLKHCFPFKTEGTKLDLIPVDIVSQSIIDSFDSNGIRHVTANIENMADIKTMIYECILQQGMFLDSTFLFPVFSTINIIRWILECLPLILISWFYFIIMKEKKSRFYWKLYQSIKKSDSLFVYFVTYKWLFEKSLKYAIEEKEYCSLVFMSVRLDLLKMKRMNDLVKMPLSPFFYLYHQFNRLRFGLFDFTMAIFYYPVFILLKLLYTSIEIEFKNEIELFNSDYIYVIVANHRSHMDNIIIKTILNIYYGWKIINPIVIVTKELLKIPIIGYIIRKTGCISIDRNNFDKECMTNEINKILHQGKHLMFYPEGTRSRTNKIQQFKYGICQLLARKTQLRYLPISISYQMVPEHKSYKNEIYSSELPSYTLSASLSWLASSIKHYKKYGKVRVVIGESVPMSDYDKLQKIIEGNIIHLPILKDNVDNQDEEMWKY